MLPTSRTSTASRSSLPSALHPRAAQLARFLASLRAARVPAEFHELHRKLFGRFFGAQRLVHDGKGRPGISPALAVDWGGMGARCTMNRQAEPKTC
jgi:hypothetical protein